VIKSELNWKSTCL